MKLISQGYDNCVMRAISTVCAALDIPQPELPEPVSDHNNQWVTEQLVRCLPGREILVWCEPNTVTDNVLARITYMGVNFYTATDPRTVFDNTDYIVLYAFSCTGIDVAHMVIGYPPFGYPNVVIRYMAAIKL